MKNGISAKIKKKIDNITALKNKLNNWKTLTEIEVLETIKAFEKTPRDEGSSAYGVLFSDEDFAKELLEIGKNYENNNKVNIYIVSSLGNMMRRYNLKETKSIYNYFLSNMYKKEVSVYVSFFLTNMTHFESYNNQWEYIMSIKDMKPSKRAKPSFESIVNSRKDSIPLEHYETLYKYFIKEAEKANNEGGKKHYLGIAESFR